MTGNEYRQAIATLGLTQASAARFLRIDPRTSKRYANRRSKRTGSTTPFATSLLLRLMIAQRLTPEAVNALLGEKGVEK